MTLLELHCQIPKVLTYLTHHRYSDAGLEELRKRFEAGGKPKRSLQMMETRAGMCRACTL